MGLFTWCSVIVLHAAWVRTVTGPCVTRMESVMSDRWPDNDPNLITVKHFDEGLSVHVFDLGSRIDIRVERDGSPSYAALDKDLLPAIVAMLIDSGFVPDWSK